MRLFCSLIFCCLLAISSSSIASDPVHTCNENMPASTPDSQLTDNGNGTITDTRTGLMWKKCVEGMDGTLCEIGAASTFTWQNALQRPGEVNSSSGFAGYTDWRLPNIKELRSIVEEKCCAPALNLTRFPNAPSEVVWSGSPHADYSNYAWLVYFSSGDSGYAGRSGALHVRLVRGGQ